MWGITSRSRTQLRILRNAFRGKSSKDRCDNYKENYGYYVSIKRRIRKRLRNIRNWLRNIRDLFLIFENPPDFFFVFSKKKKWIGHSSSTSTYPNTSPKQAINSPTLKSEKNHQAPPGNWTPVLLHHSLHSFL